MNCIIKTNEFQQSWKKVLLIDQKSIREILDESLLFVIDKNNKVLKREIQLGQIINNKQIVTNGLEVGKKSSSKTSKNQGRRNCKNNGL